eukprot:SAG31_NODE_742_length_12424_cov_16.082353_15_plen_73_part_01
MASPNEGYADQYYPKAVQRTQPYFYFYTISSYILYINFIIIISFYFFLFLFLTKSDRSFEKKPKTISNMPHER